MKFPNSRAIGKRSSWTEGDESIRKRQEQSLGFSCIAPRLYCCLAAKSCLTLLGHHGLEPLRRHHPWNFPGMNTRVGCHFLLQGIFPTQGLNPRLLCLLHGQAVADYKITQRGREIILKRLVIRLNVLRWSLDTGFCINPDITSSPVISFPLCHSIALHKS